MNTRVTARTAVIGLILSGFAIGPATAGDPLPQRARQNLLALARLHRLVRFYHPSELAERMDWNTRLCAHLAEVERAADDPALIEALRRFVADLDDPTVRIGLIGGAAPPPPPDGGPLAGTLQDTLYARASAADSGPSLIEAIESALAARQAQPQNWLLTRWVLDLRGTAGRSFESIDRELTEALTRTLPGKLHRPPRRRRMHHGFAGAAGPTQTVPTHRVDRPVALTGESLLGGQRLFLLVDETTHPAAGGWLLGRQQSGSDIAIGRPCTVLAEPPYAAALSPTVEVTFPLSHFLNTRGDPQGPKRFLPDVPRSDLPTEGTADAMLMALHQRGLLDTPAREPGEGRTRKEAGRPPAESPGRAARRAGAQRRSPRGEPPRQAPCAAESPRTARLADLLTAYAVVGEFFPGWNVLAVGPDALLAEALAAAADTDAAPTAGIERFLTGLTDANAALRTPDAPPLLAPAVETRLIEDQLVVVRADPDLAGVVPGDVVQEIDGEPAGSRLGRLAAGISGSPQWMRHRLACLALAGPEDTSARVSLASGAGRAGRAVELPRIRPAGQWPRTKPPAFHRLDGGIAYLDLTRLPGARARRLLAESPTAGGVVLDLRGEVTPNAHLLLRHLADRQIAAAAQCLPVRSHPTGPAEEKRYNTWKVQPAEPRVHAPVVALVDGSTVGAAELIAEAIQRCRLGTLCGENTAGAPGEASRARLPSGARLTWSGTRVVDAAGRDIFAAGVQPEIRPARTVAGARAERDELLEAAVARLTGR